MFKNVMRKFKQYFITEEMSDLNSEMKQGVVLTEDERSALMRLTNQLFDRYDVDKSDALDIHECKKIFNDIF